jgi:hypothetical protein
MTPPNAAPSYTAQGFINGTADITFLAPWAALVDTPRTPLIAPDPALLAII